MCVGSVKLTRSKDPADAGSEENVVEQSSDIRSIADDFRAWVIADLQALPESERVGFRGDYLFVIDGQPLFLVLVSPRHASSMRLDAAVSAAQAQQAVAGEPLVADLGEPVVLQRDDLTRVLDGQVRVCVRTDTHTLRRLLQGNLRAKVAYLNGMVKISGDLPCFMRLVAVLKGRGVGPLKARPGACDA